MKRAKTLLFLAGLLILATVAYVVTSSLNKKENEPDETESTEITVTDYDTSAVSNVTYSISDSDSNVSIDCGKDGYSYASDPAFPLDQSKASLLVSSALSITASGEIKNPDALDEYGLTEPKKHIEITLNSGEKKTVSIGDYNKYSDFYYAAISGSDSVYYVSEDYVDLFNLSLNELIVNDVNDEPDDGIDAVTSIVIETEGKTVKYVFVPEVPEEYEDETVVKEAIPAHWVRYDNEELVSAEADDEAKKAYGQIFSLKTDWIEYNVTDWGKRSEYGLNPPVITATVNYTEKVTVAGGESSTSIETTVEKSASVHIGNVQQTEDTEGAADRYFRVGNGKIVYSVSEDDIDMLIIGAEE
ncbi:MAG: DUF4340 domain-containing protein [Firmicutes bacterium]|nr:DUF4340 domain-containing protein [Candidatus Colimorpha enterica]